MRTVAICILLGALVGCGTVKGTASGFLDGASQDLGNLSRMITKPKE